MPSADLETGARTGRTWEVKRPVQIKADVRLTAAQMAKEQASGLALAQKRLQERSAREYQTRLRAFRARRAMWLHLHQATKASLTTVAATKPVYRTVTTQMRVYDDTLNRMVWQNVTRRVLVPPAPSLPRIDTTPNFGRNADVGLAKEAFSLRQSGASLTSFYAKRDFNHKAQITLDNARANPGNTAAGRALEVLTGQIRDAQKASGGHNLNSELVKQLYDAYQKHVEFVASRFSTFVDKLKEYYTVDKGRLVAPKDAKSHQKAMALYASPEFRAIQSEYRRLYEGKGGKGSINDFVTAADQIGNTQREYLYLAAKNSVFNRAMTLRKHGSLVDAQALTDQFQNGAQYLNDDYAKIVQATIDPTKTSFKMVVGPSGSVTRVQRTVAEEYEYRRSVYIAEMRRQYQEAQNSLVLEQQSNRESLHAGGGQFASDQQAIADAAKSIGVSDFSKADSISTVVSQAMAAWDTRTQATYFSAEERRRLATNGRPAGAVRSSQNYRDWMAARDAQEQRFYAVFSAKKPGVLETVLNFGPVKGVTDVLGAGEGAIGALLKQLATVTSGAPAEFIASGDNLNYNELLPPQRNLVDARASALLADRQWLLAHSIRGSSDALRASWARNQAMHEVVSEFIKTPEGDAWATKSGQTVGGVGVNTGRTQSEKQRLFNELSDFYQKFNVQGFGQSPLGSNAPLAPGAGNTGSILSALTGYGSQPFSPDSVIPNLAAGIALDPTNALPLKFTTWLKRFNYAVDTTRDVNGLKRATMGVGTWLKVTEPELRLQKFLGSQKLLLDSGVNPATVRETLLAQLAGIKDKGLRKNATESFLQLIGVTPRNASYHDAFSLVEDAVNKFIDKQGIDHLSLTKQIKGLEDARVASEAAAKLASQAESARVVSAAARREAAVAKPALAARARTEARRQAEIAAEAGTVPKIVSPRIAARQAAAVARKAAVADNPRFVGESLRDYRARVQQAVLGGHQPHADILGREAGSEIQNRLTAVEGHVSALEHLRVSPSRSTTPSRPARAANSAALAESLTSLAKDTLRSDFPVHALDGFEQVASRLKALPEFRSVMAKVEQNIGTDLWASRLGTYFRHEDYFKRVLRGDQAAVLPMAGKSGTIEAKMAAGDVAGSQADNVAVGVSRGGTLESGGATKPNVASGDTLSEAMASRTLELASGLSEEQWLKREAARANRLYESGPRAGRSAAFQRRLDAQRALHVLSVMKSGGSFAPPIDRVAHIRRVVRINEKRAVASFAPSNLAPYVSSPEGAVVEQTRSLRRKLISSPVNAEFNKVDMVGSVSKAYVGHRRALEAVLDQIISPAALKRFGIHEDAMRGMSYGTLLSNLDEFQNAMRDSKVRAFVEEIQIRAEARMREVARNKKYTLQQFFSDQLMNRSDHYDPALWETHEKAVTPLIRAARDGRRRTTLTDLRRKPEGGRASEPTAAVLDRDVAAIRAKTEYLRSQGETATRYNEARHVYRSPYLRREYSLRIHERARAAATAELSAAGHAPGSKHWAAEWQSVVDKHYGLQRDVAAAKEAHNLLSQLAGEMEGASPEQVISAFEGQYSLSRDVKGFDATPISPFQKRSLEEAVKKAMNVSDPYDVKAAAEYLRSHGQGPPDLNHASTMRDWFVKRGVWTPRTAEAIDAGKKSWSIDEEAKFFHENWAYVPDRANRSLLSDTARPESDIFHSEDAYQHFMRKWGVFSSNLSGRFEAPLGRTREQFARELAAGNPALGRQPKRDLALERKFAFERFGSLVGSKDANGVIHLHSMPWLMTAEEHGAYFEARAGQAIAHDLPQNAEELAVVNKIIHSRIKPYFDAMMSGKVAGDAVSHADVLTVSAYIVHDLLSHPVWAKRGRDFVGTLLRTQASIRRRLVFTQLGFMTTNILDAAIKEPWASWTHRAFRSGEPLSAKAQSLDLFSLALDRSSTLLVDVPVHGTQRIASAFAGTKFESFVARIRGKTVSRSALDTTALKLEGKTAFGRALDAAVGVLDLPAQGARLAEEGAKLRLARGMYDGVYSRALKMLGDPGSADAATRMFIHDELKRLWPTVGDGPVERLFNSLSPFLSYKIKNTTFYVGEMFAHPALYNWFNRIGNTIEYYNRQEWAKTHDASDPISDVEARLIRLPWAPDAFIDLGSFSDAQRGLKPLYKMASGGSMTVAQFASSWVSVVSPNDINVVLGLFNEFHLMPKYGWAPTIVNGYATGKYHQVIVPWQAPWGGVADWRNSFWPLELWQNFQTAAKGGLSAGEATLLGAQALFFGGVRLHDSGAGLNTYYWALKAANPDAAAAWLNTPDGMNLRARWADHASTASDFFTPAALHAMLNPSHTDPSPWFHAQSQSYQERIKANLDDLTKLRAKWDHVLAHLAPGTKQYTAAKLAAATERYQYYAAHPELYDATVMFQTPAQWGKQLDSWMVDDLVQGYYNLSVSNGDYAALRKARALYLAKFPQVAGELSKMKTGLDGIWQAQEQHWFSVLDEVGTRGIAITAAREAKNFQLTDQLYLLNELSMETLNKDTLSFYFDPTTDFKALPSGSSASPSLLQGPFGQALTPLVKVLPDFNSWRFSRMNEAQKSTAVRTQKYFDGIKAIIAKAKASGNFGATFVSEMKAHPDLLREYFARHPGKQHEWAANDSYIKAMSGYGRLVKASRWSEAGRYLASLPDWIKARYYAKHPDRKAALQQNVQYLGLMEKWTNFYRHRDYAGGASYFAALPAWVKDRFYSSHPTGQFKGSSPYSDAMGKWVKLLQDHKTADAKTYFDSLPQAFKDRYYAGHPQQKLQTDVLRVGQLARYFGSDDLNRAVYLNDNPEFGKWLKAHDTSASSHQMLVLAAYTSLPKGDAWLRRVFRERYPEIFSQQGKAQGAINKVFSTLGQHPELAPEWQRWVTAILSSYADSLRHAKAAPKPLEFVHPRRMKTKPPHGRGASAEWVRLHAVS